MTTVFEGTERTRHNSINRFIAGISAPPPKGSPIRWPRSLFMLSRAAGALLTHRGCEGKPRARRHALNPVCGPRHDLRNHGHETPCGRRQRKAACLARDFAVMRLVQLHLTDDRSAALVRRRQPAEVLLEMTDDLRLGLRDEAEAPAVSGQPGASAEDEGARVPQRPEPARMIPKLSEALLAPGKMIEFLYRGLFHGAPHRVQPGSQRLSLVETLRHDLSRVVDAHQCGGMAALALRHGRLREVGRGIRPRGRWRRRQHGAHRLVDLFEDPVHRAESASRHGDYFSASRATEAGCSTGMGSPIRASPATKCMAQPMLLVTRACGGSWASRARAGSSSASAWRGWLRKWVPAAPQQLVGSSRTARSGMRSSRRRVASAVPVTLRCVQGTCSTTERYRLRPNSSGASASNSAGSRMRRAKRAPGSPARRAYSSKVAAQPEAQATTGPSPGKAARFCAASRLATSG